MGNAAILANVVLQLLTSAQAYQARLASGEPITDADVDAALAQVGSSRAQLAADIAAAKTAP
jgi:hypothetical protein